MWLEEQFHYVVTVGDLKEVLKHMEDNIHLSFRRIPTSCNIPDYFLGCDVCHVKGSDYEYLDFMYWYEDYKEVEDRDDLKDEKYQRWIKDHPLMKE